MLSKSLRLLLLKEFLLAITTLTVVSQEASEASQASCGSPGRPAHGHLSVLRSSFQAGQTVQFTCEQRLVVVGTSERKCLPNGTWTNQVPFCVDPAPPQVVHSIRTGIANCTSQFNRTVDGDDQKCTNVYVNGSTTWWVIDLYQIKDEVNILEVILRAEVPAVKENLQDIVQVTLTDYHPDPATNVRCNSRTPRTNWTKHTARLKVKQRKSQGRFLSLRSEKPPPFSFIRICEIIFLTREHSLFSCGDPEVPLHGMVTRSERHTAFYQCSSKGYDIVGPTTRTCHDDNEWSGTMPLCRPNFTFVNESLNPTFPTPPCDYNSSYPTTTDNQSVSSSSLPTEPPTSPPSLLPVQRVTAIQPFVYIAVAVGVLILLLIIGFSFFICHLRHHSKPSANSSAFTSATEEILLNDTYYSDCNNEYPLTIVNNYVDNPQGENQTSRRTSRLPSSSSNTDRRASACSSNGTPSKRPSFGAEMRERVAVAPPPPPTIETRNSTGSLLLNDQCSHIYSEICEEQLPPTPMMRRSHPGNRSPSSSQPVVLSPVYSEPDDINQHKSIPPIYTEPYATHNHPTNYL